MSELSDSPTISHADHLLAAVASRRVASTPSRGDHIVDLFHNCLNLLTQNKINEKNSWDLKLIDHLSDFVKLEADNFLKASSALEVSVKIYSVRVDSLHSQAYKFLGRFSRTGLEYEQEIEFDHENDCRESLKEGQQKKLSPLATLESSFEALNLKKFDVAFSEELLCRETSAMVNDRGARGLLLNSLGVYGDCCVFFGSLEVPGKERLCLDRNEGSAFIDLSFMKESTAQMVINMRTNKSEISPTLREIIYHFDSSNQCSREALNIGQSSDLGSFSNDNQDFSFDHVDNETAFQRDEFEFDSTCHEFDISTLLLFQHNLAGHDRFNSMRNDWAGPDHWKYPNPIGTNKARATFKSRRSKKKKAVDADLNFSSSISEKMCDDIFAPPRNAKSLLLPVSRSPRCNSLPRDCHYEVKDLLKLFLLPNVQCLGKQHGKYSGSDSWEENNYFAEPLPSWDEENDLSGEFNDGDISRDFEDPDGLFFPDQVNQDWIRYENASKQVDMTLLKQSLWDQMQQVVVEPELVRAPILSRISDLHKH